MNVSAILVAAGAGTRMGGSTPKAFLPVAGIPLLAHALQTIGALPTVRSLILVVPGNRRVDAMSIVAERRHLHAAVEIVAGGAERQDSVVAGLAYIDDAELVVVHDAARPFATPELFTRCIEAAAEFGAAIAALPASDTVKRVGADDIVQETIERSAIWLAQTPQVFRVDLLRRAFEAAARESFIGTDEAAVVERLGFRVRVVPGEAANRKLTTPEDIIWANWVATGRAS
jgi:2-C-methyl-D-erythritol 4-phosphate cytidylyltransferase